MALQTGLSAGKILVIVGAGYTGTILLKNGKLSDLIGELQSIVKGFERSGERTDGDSDLSDAVAQQVRRLALEVRQLASARQITVIGGGGYGQGNLSGIIVPAAAVGAMGYGYMWWKGLKFTDLMYVTKKSMASAVANLNKHLEQVTGALTAAKEHLTQRLQHLDDKVETQKEISKQIQFDISCTSENLTQIDGDLRELQDLVASLKVHVPRDSLLRVGKYQAGNCSSSDHGMNTKKIDTDSKVLSLEDKQNLANTGVLYLCSFVQSSGKKGQMPKALEDKLKSSGRTFSSLTYKEPGLKQLTEIKEKVVRAQVNDKPRDAAREGLDIVEESTTSPQTRPLQRMRSAFC